MATPKRKSFIISPTFGKSVSACQVRLRRTSEQRRIRLGLLHNQHFGFMRYGGCVRQRSNELSQALF